VYAKSPRFFIFINTDELSVLTESPTISTSSPGTWLKKTSAAGSEVPISKNVIFTTLFSATRYIWKCVARINDHRKVHKMHYWAQKI